MIMMNGKVVAQGSQFSLNDVEVVTATLDLEEVRSYRCLPSHGLQAINSPTYKRVEVDVSLSDPGEEVTVDVKPSSAIDIKYHKPEEEIA
jgi:NAD+ synthase (glutamine-hydrolysing)